MAKRTTTSHEDRHQAILRDAKTESEQIIKALPDKQKIKRENYRRIYEIASKLLADKESFIRPDAENLAKYAQIGGMTFITPRTLLNWYRDMIAVWVRAHKDMVAVRMANILAGEDVRRYDELQIDAEIQCLGDINRVLYRENCELRGRLSSKQPDITPESTPDDFHERTTPNGAEFVDLRPLRKWVNSLERDSSFLEITETGLKISRKARFGVTVMSREVYEMLRSM
ncbi:UNVERIFIED_ORG: hypothetical protein GGD59_000523 [Rhizobium esperanzae]